MTGLRSQRRREREAELEPGSLNAEGTLLTSVLFLDHLLVSLPRRPRDLNLRLPTNSHDPFLFSSEVGIWREGVGYLPRTQKPWEMMLVQVLGEEGESGGSFYKLWVPWREGCLSHSVHPYQLNPEPVREDQGSPLPASAHAWRTCV